MNKIKPIQWYSFLVDWYEDKYSHQRMGQAFFNKFMGPEPCTELFYEEDTEVCGKYILENCLDFGEE